MRSVADTKGRFTAAAITTALIAMTYGAAAPPALAATPYIERSVEHAQMANIFSSTCPDNRRVVIPGPACSMTDILAVSGSDPTGQPAQAYLDIHRASLTPAVGYPSGFMWYRYDFGVTRDAQLAVAPGTAAATASGQVPVRSCEQLWEFWSTDGREQMRPHTPPQCSNELWQIDSDWTANGNGHADNHGFAIADYEPDINWVSVGAHSTRGRHAVASAVVNGIVVSDGHPQYLDTWIGRGTDVRIAVFPDGAPDWWTQSPP